MWLKEFRDSFSSLPNVNTSKLISFIFTSLYSCTKSFIFIFLSFDYSIEQKPNRCNETWNHEYEAGNQTWHHCVRYIGTESKCYARGNSRQAILNKNFTTIDMCYSVQYRFTWDFSYLPRGHQACCCNCYTSTFTTWQCTPHGKDRLDQNPWNLCSFDSFYLLSKRVVRGI